MKPQLFLLVAEDLPDQVPGMCCVLTVQLQNLYLTSLTYC
jgi:hypothetical protein